jgi:hypothetical protein
MEDLQGLQMLFYLGKYRVQAGDRESVRSGLWPTGYRRGHARRSFQIDGRADLATHTQASDEAGPASGYTPGFLNSKAGEILSASQSQSALSGTELPRSGE